MAVPNTPPNKFASVLAAAAATLSGSGGGADYRKPVNVASFDGVYDPETASTIFNVVFTQPIPWDTAVAGLTGHIQSSAAQFAPALARDEAVCTGFTFETTAEQGTLEFGFYVLDAGW